MRSSVHSPLRRLGGSSCCPLLNFLLCRACPDEPSLVSSSPIMPAGPASCSLRRRGSSRPATEAHQTRLRNKSRSEVGGILSLRTPSFASRSETSAPIALHGAQLGYLLEETAKRRFALPVIAPARQTNDVARRLPATEDIAAASDRGYRRSQRPRISPQRHRLHDKIAPSQLRDPGRCLFLLSS